MVVSYSAERNVPSPALFLHFADAKKQGCVVDAVRFPKRKLVVALAFTLALDLLGHPLEMFFALVEHENDLLLGPIEVELEGRDVVLTQKQLVDFAYGCGAAVFRICVIIPSCGRKGKATAMIAEKACAICSSVAWARISSLGRSGA